MGGKLVELQCTKFSIGKHMTLYAGHYLFTNLSQLFRGAYYMSMLPALTFICLFMFCIRWFTRDGWRRTKEDIILEVTFLHSAYNLL